MSINHVIVSGNLSNEPEIRQTSGGLSVCTFGICVNDKRKNQQTGEYEDYPNFVDCTAFGGLAELLVKNIAKGSRVVIDGRIHQSTWQTKDGSKRSKVDVIVNECQYMTSQPKQQQQQQAVPVQNQATPVQNEPQYSDTDIPF